MRDSHEHNQDHEKEARRRILDELAAESQRLGFYDDPHPNATPSPLAGDKPRS